MPSGYRKSNPAPPPYFFCSRAHDRLSSSEPKKPSQTFPMGVYTFANKWKEIAAHYGQFPSHILNRLFCDQYNFSKFYRKFYNYLCVKTGMHVALAIHHSLTSLLFPGIHAPTFISLPWLTTPWGVLGYAVEAVQLRGVNRSWKRRAEAMSGGGRYLKGLGD